MPHLTLDIEPLGPMVQVYVAVSPAHRKALIAAGLPVPDGVIARALVDTGASSSMVDPFVPESLRLKPTSVQMVHTPSTNGTPVPQLVYDVSIWWYHAAQEYVWGRSVPVACAGLRSQGIDMLLGRDILGESLLVYDGPSRRFSIAF